MTSSLDLAALSRKELQVLAKEFQLCRGNAKNDVILQHAQDFLAANPSDGEARVRNALGLASDSTAATSPPTPAKVKAPVVEKKSPAPAPTPAAASPASTKASPKAKAEKAVTPRKEEATSVTAKPESAKKTPETKAARKSPARSDAAPVVMDDAKTQKSKTPEKKIVTSSPVVSAKKVDAAKQTPPKKAPVKKSPGKEMPAKKSPAKENPKDATPNAKAGRPALASLDANVVKSNKAKKGGKVTVDSLVSSIDDLAFAGDGSRVRCTTTGHEMKADVDVIATYINGKSYLKAKLKKQSFSSYAPMFVAHPDEKKTHLLWCNVTETEHPRDVARVEAHIAGSRYQKDLPRWEEEEAARVKTEKEAEAKKAARNKARAEKLKQLENGTSTSSTSSDSKKRTERSSSSKKSKTEAVEAQEEAGEKKAKRPHPSSSPSSLTRVKAEWQPRCAVAFVGARCHLVVSVAKQINEKDAMEFLVPLHLADLELPKAERYHVRHVHALDDLDDKEIASRLRKLEQHVLSTTDAGLELLQEECLDFCYSLVKKHALLSESIQLRVVEVLTAFVNNVTDGVRTLERSTEPEEIDQYRGAFKVSVYFLIMTLTALSHQLLQQEKDIVAKKKKASAANRVNWSRVVETAIQALTKSISTETFGLWKMNLPEEEFAVLYSKVVFQLLENTQLCRSKTLRPKLYHLVGKSLQKVPAIHISVVTSLVELIYAHEHLSGWVADMVELLYFKYENLVFAADLISEIGKTSSRDASKDTIGTKNISTFLSNLSTLTPYLIMENLSFVLALLDSESYQLRNASVTCITQILLWNFRQKGNQIDQSEESREREEEEKARKQASLDRRNDQGGSDDSDDEHDEEETSATVPDRAAARRDLSRSTRDQLLDVLEDRMHDVNSFARSHVLKMWYLLCEEGALPIHMLKRVTLIAVGRLQDKAAVVRRHSMHLLTLLLESNPFMGNLERASYSAKRDELLEELKKKRDEMIAHAEKEVQAAMSDVQIGEEDAGETDEVADNERKVQLEQEVKTMARLLQFYEDAMSFIDEFELKALPLITQLLGSKSISDVLEAIQFFEKAYRFHLQAAYAGIKKMLTLIWRADPSVHDQLLNTFASLFIQIDASDPDRESPEAIAENLVKFLDECTVAEYTCLEKIVGELHQKRLIPMSVINALWDFVDETAYPAAVLGNALSMLSMIASVDRAMLLSNDRLSQIYANGFGDVSCKTDVTTRVLSAACRLIQCLHLDSKSAANASIRQRIQRVNLETIEQIVARLQGFLVLEFAGKDQLQVVSSQSAWFDTAQQAIEAIFSICEKPEEICGEVVRHLSQGLFQDEDEQTISIFELAHFLFVVGHVAVKIAVHIEKLATSVKKLRVKHEEKLSKRTGSMDERENTAAEDVSAMEDELGVAAEVEAEEDMYVQNMTQKEIVCRNLLGMYAPLIIRVLRGGNDEISGDELLIECAVVALSKFMAVSDEFCEKHLQLLFTILQESPLPSVRGDVIIALGDLSYRYPNLIEPWTTHLYNRLRDVDLNVRKNTIVVLSHLILNDMIKVKAQISEIAISLVDEEEGIRNMTKLFFHELSKKGTNPIYNMLPDAIGQLSSSELVSNENFESISRFMIQFLTKEKQIESIVEKLCQRFPSAVKVKHQRDLSFCLAQLSHTEKSLRYMVQNRKLMRDALTDSGVTENFSHLVNKVRRGNNTASTTSEMKDAIDQLEKIVVSAENGEEEDDVTVVEGGSVAPREPATPKPKARGRRGSKKTREPAVQVVVESAVKPKRSARQTKKKAKARVVESSSSASSDDDDDE